MPGYGSLAPLPGGIPRFKKYNVGVSVMDITGETASENIWSFDDNITEGQADNWVEAYGELSNAAVISHRITTDYSVFKGDVVPYDEALSDVGSAAVFVFQNRTDPRDMKRVKVFAFDMEYVEHGRILLDNEYVERFVDRTLGILNDGGLIDDGDYRLLKAYITKGRGHERYAETLGYSGQAEEPGIGDHPGEGPGDNPLIDLP